MGISLLLASAASGCISRTFVHPMDTLRSLQMVSRTNQSLLSTARAVLSKDGFRGFYRGFGIAVVMQAPAISTYLTTYDLAKKNLPLPLAAPPAATHLAAGLVAEAVSAVFWVPMEVIKQRAQVRQGALSAAGSSVVVRDLVRREGVRALFSGYGLTLGAFGPYAMVYFVMYERFKAMAGEGERPLGTPVVAGCAATAGAIAGAITTPLDVIKTRIQTQGDVGGGYRGTWHAVRVISRQEGIRGFGRGFLARILWLTPGTAITFSTFEFLKQYFKLGG